MIFMRGFFICTLLQNNVEVLFITQAIQVNYTLI